MTDPKKPEIVTPKQLSREEQILGNEFCYVLMTLGDLESQAFTDYRRSMLDEDNEPTYACKFVSDIRVARLTERHVVVPFCPPDIDKPGQFQFRTPVPVKQFWNPKREDCELDVGKFINAVAKSARPYVVQHKNNPTDQYDLGALKLAAC